MQDNNNGAPWNKPPPEGIKNIHQRMIEVQKKVTSVIKNEKIETGGQKSYKGVSHDDVAILLHTPLADAGIVLLPTVTEFVTSNFDVEKKGQNGSYKQHWYRTDIKINVKWINADFPFDFIESNGGAFALDTSDKGFAKAYSLALKIVLLKVHLLESKDDEEQREFEKGQQQSTAKPNSPPAQKSNAKSPPAKTTQQKSPTGIHAAADQKLMDRMLDLTIDRGLHESELNTLISQGYGYANRAIPVWVAEEVIKTLSRPECDSHMIQVETQRVATRRAARNASKS